MRSGRCRVLRPCSSALWTVEWIDDDDRFRSLSGEWDRLYSRCPSLTPFATHSWLHSWWVHYRRSAAMRVLLVRRDAELVAAAPLMLTRRLGVRVLRPLGTDLSDYCDVLVDDRHRDEATEHLAGALLDAPGWSVLDIAEAPPHASVHALGARWPGRRWTLPASTCLHLPDPDLSALLHRLPARTRNTLRRKLRKAEALGIVERQVRAAQVPGAVTELLRLHGRQWAGRGGNPEHTTARFRGFLGQAVAALAGQGRASVQEYLLDGRVVAAEILLIDRDRTASYLMGVDPHLRKRIDTATMLLRRNLTLAARSGTRLDLLRGTEDYKRRWRPHEAVNRRVILARRSPGAIAYAAAVRSRRLLADLVRADAPGLLVRCRRVRPARDDVRRSGRAVITPSTLIAAGLLVCLIGLGCPAAASPDTPSPVSAASGAGSAAGPLPGLGVDVHLEGFSRQARREQFRQLAGMGASWVRLGAPWYAVQPRSRAVSSAGLAQLDEQLADATAAGLHVLFTADQAPNWAGGGGATASSPADYGAYLGLLARHFRGRGPGATSPAYELMNEPNGRQPDGHRWAAPEAYARAACEAYRAVKAADPSTTVVAGSLDVSDWRPWLSEALHRGLSGCFDVLSAHPYPDWDVLPRIRDLAASSGAGERPVWVTEFGFSTCGDPLYSCVSPTEQAQGLVERLRELGRDYPWVPVAIIYEARDEPHATGDPSQRAFGLFTGRDAKPAVAALRSLYTGS